MMPQSGNTHFQKEAICPFAASRFVLHFSWLLALTIEIESVSSSLANCREVEKSFGDNWLMMQHERPDCFEFFSEEREEEDISSIKDWCKSVGGMVHSFVHGGVCSRRVDGAVEYLSLYSKEWGDCEEHWFFDDTDEECEPFSSEFCHPSMLSWYCP